MTTLSTNTPKGQSRADKRRASALVEQSGLPPTIQLLILRVVRRTRLWRREQADVARELIAHFADGLTPPPSAFDRAPRTPDDLIASFGDERAAAKLIRRAKRRGRPWHWHVRRRMLHGVGIVVLLIVGMWVRFFLGKPTISRNYLAELNAPIHAVPEAERAWPMYRRGLLALPVVPAELLEKDTRGKERRPEEYRPDDPQWPTAIAYFDAAERSLELFRAAAALPSLGRPLSATEADVELVDHLNTVYHKPRAAVPAPAPLVDPTSIVDNPSLFSILLPELGHMRSIARLLAADARIAAEQSDAARAESDLNALLGLASHSGDTGFLISSLVGIAIDSLQQATLMEVLERHPALFDERTLGAIAHRLAARKSAPSLFGETLRKERMFFEDFLQRTFTDNGCGDGRITPTGLRFLGAIHGPPSGGQVDLDQAFGMAVAPIAVASRREQLAAYDRLLAAAQAEAITPPGERPRSADSAFIQTVDRGFNRTRYAPVGALLPALSNCALRFRNADQTRDASLAVLAVHVFRLETGRWPHTLDELAPRLLPTVPIDVFDGKPLKYRLIDGSPIVYSVGSNDVDDGGAPTGARQFAGVRRASDIPKGDWIFFPPSRAHEPEAKPANSAP